MFAHQSVFSRIEEVIEEMLVPGRGVSGGEGAEPDGEDIHMEESYLSPGAEGWGEPKICWIA